MRKYIAAVIMALASSTAQADAAAESAEYCKSISDLASSIMELRQDGVPMSRLLDGFAKVQNDYSALTKLIVIDAYERPRFDVEPYRQRAIVDFVDAHYLLCVKNEVKNGRQ